MLYILGGDAVIYYLSGPISNDDPVIMNKNLEHFDAVAKMLRDRGDLVYNPAEVSRELGLYRPWG